MRKSRLISGAVNSFATTLPEAGASQFDSRASTIPTPCARRKALHHQRHERVGADFELNPDPIGGTATFSVIGSFDTLNPFIIKGTPVAGVGLLFETLAVSSLDEFDRITLEPPFGSGPYGTGNLSVTVALSDGPGRARWSRRL